MNYANITLNTNTQYTSSPLFRLDVLVKALNDPRITEQDLKHICVMSQKVYARFYKH